MDRNQKFSTDKQDSLSSNGVPVEVGMSVPARKSPRILAIAMSLGLWVVPRTRTI